MATESTTARPSQQPNCQQPAGTVAARSSPLAVRCSPEAARCGRVAIVQSSERGFSPAAAQGRIRRRALRAPGPAGCRVVSRGTERTATGTCCAADQFVRGCRPRLRDPGVLRPRPDCDRRRGPRAQGAEPDPANRRGWLRAGQGLPASWTACRRTHADMPALNRCGGPGIRFYPGANEIRRGDSGAATGSIGRVVHF